MKTFKHFFENIEKERKQIVDIFNKLDLSNPEDAALVDKIWRILNKDHFEETINNMISKPFVDETEMDVESVKKDLVQTIFQLENDKTAINEFLENINNTGSAISVDPLIRGGGTVPFGEIFPNELTENLFLTLKSYGSGTKQKGPGEFAFAMLSDRIKLSTKGDIEIDNNLIELKVDGGRLALDVKPRRVMLQILQKYNIPSVLDHIETKSASLNLRNLITYFNNDNVDKQIRGTIAAELYTDIFSNTGVGSVVKSFKSNTDPDRVVKDYNTALYTDYQKKDGFTGLLIVDTRAKKSAYVKNVNEFGQLYASGQLGIMNVSVIPSGDAATREYFPKLQLSKKG